VTSDETPISSRRAFLRAAGVTALAAFAGCNEDTQQVSRTETASGTTRLPTATESPTTESPTTESPTTESASPTTAESDLPQIAEQYETAVDITETAVDGNGDTPIEPALSELVADDMLVYFPPGRYRMDGPWEHVDFSRLALVGEDATIVPPQEYAGYMFILGRRGGDASATGLRFEGFTFDYSARQTGPRALHFHVADGLQVRDVRIDGVSDTNENATRFGVIDPDGSGEVRRLQLPNGSTGHRAVGCLVPRDNRGTLTFRDCRIEGFLNNGLYASPSTGQVNVFGGAYVNNDISNVRVSGPAHVRNVYSLTDTNSSEPLNMRGVRLRNAADIVVENCRVQLLNAPHADGALVVESDVDVATIRNTAIQVEADGLYAIRIKTGQDDRDGGVSHFRFEDVQVTGSASGGSAVGIVDRRDVLFRNLEITQPGANRNGLNVVRSSGIRLRDSVINVTETPIVRRNSTVQTTNTQLSSTATPVQRTETRDRSNRS